MTNDSEQIQEMLGRLGGQMDSLASRFTYMDKRSSKILERLTKLEADNVRPTLIDFEQRLRSIEGANAARQGVTMMARNLPQWIVWAVAPLVGVGFWVMDHWKG